MTICGSHRVTNTLWMKLLILADVPQTSCEHRIRSIIYQLQVPLDLDFLHKKKLEMKEQQGSQSLCRTVVFIPMLSSRVFTARGQHLGRQGRHLGWRDDIWTTHLVRFHETSTNLFFNLRVILFTTALLKIRKYEKYLNMNCVDLFLWLPMICLLIRIKPI